MPDIKTWFLSHSPMRLRVEQMALEDISVMLIENPLFNQHGWFSTEQKSLIGEAFPRTVTRTPLTGLSHGLRIELEMEALEHALAFLASRLKSSSGMDMPHPGLLARARQLEDLLKNEQALNKPPCKYTVRGWKKILTYCLNNIYIAFLLDLVARTTEKEGLDAPSTILAILSRSVRVAANSPIKRVLDAFAGSTGGPVPTNPVAEEESETDGCHVHDPRSFLDAFYRRYSVATRGEGIYLANIDDPEWVMNDIDTALIGWLDKYKKSWDDSDIGAFLSTQGYVEAVKSSLISRLQHGAFGYRVFLPLELNFKADALNSEPFGFSLAVDLAAHGVDPRLVPPGYQGGWAMAEVVAVFSGEDAASETLKRIENWLAYLSLSVKEPYYYKLIRDVRIYQSLETGRCMADVRRSVVPFLRLPSADYQRVVEKYAGILSDPRMCAKSTLRAMRFFHRALHSGEPELEFQNLWLALECLAGQGGHQKKVWSTTLPYFICESQPAEFWGQFRLATPDARKELLDEQVSEITKILDGFQKLRSTYFLHPTRPEWNEDLLAEALKKMRVVTGHALRTVLVLLREFPLVDCFKELAGQLRIRWDRTCEGDIRES